MLLANICASLIISFVHNTGIIKLKTAGKHYDWVILCCCPMRKGGGGNSLHFNHVLDENKQTATLLVVWFLKSKTHFKLLDAPVQLTMKFVLCSLEVLMKQKKR